MDSRVANTSAASSGAAASGADRQFAALARDYLDDHARRHPESATDTGDHRFDAQLGDLSAAALADERQALERYAARLAALDAGALAAEHRVDAAMLASAVDLGVFQLDELREHTWNPMLANPGQAVYQLLARDFAPLPERLAAVAGRLAAIPAALAAARAQLGNMPRVHLEAAITQFSGTISLISGEIDAALDRAPESSAELVGRVRPAALAALEEHRAWLSARLAQTGAGGQPRIGAERFARKLSLTLAAAADADAILARALADLDQVSEQISELAAELAGPAASARTSPARAAGDPDGDPVVRQVLGRLAADAADNATILPFCRAALTQATDFVADTGLVTLYSDPVEVIEMPEIDRGRGGGLLRLAGAAGARVDADVPGRVAGPGRLAGRAGRLVLPRVQPAHGAEPHRARGHARSLPPAPALPAVRRLGHRRPGGIPVRLVRRGLGRLRRAADGRARVSRRR